jgi:Ca2+-binding EF-hand superfamily protein
MSDRETRLSAAEMEELRATFHVFDRDGNGAIDASELAEMLTSLGEPPAHGEAEALIASVDSDGDGSIGLEEFIALMSGGGGQRTT